jgi:hypothetical protein
LCLTGLTLLHFSLGRERDKHQFKTSLKIIGEENRI